MKARTDQTKWPFTVEPLHPAFGCEIVGLTMEEAVGHIPQHHYAFRAQIIY